MLLWNFIGGLSIIILNAIVVGIVCLILRKLEMLRVPESNEINGLDLGARYDLAYVGGNVIYFCLSVMQYFD